MKINNDIKYIGLLLLVILVSPVNFWSQVTPPGGGFGPIGSGFNQPFNSNDSTQKNKKKWENPAPIIHYKLWNSSVERQIDTSIVDLHDLDSFSRWDYNLGNIGTATQSFLLTPQHQLGPRLNYQDLSKNVYSKSGIPFYNTTRPYSLFQFAMGSQQEQTVAITHTQNVHSRWNLAVHFKNLNSPGFFNNLLAVNNGGYFTSNYLSKNQKYSIQAGAIYNRLRNDENGGIVSDTLLLEDNFVNTRQIPTAITSVPTNRNRSKVTNTYRNAQFFFTHEYRQGVTDSLYNEDSTQLTITFKPSWSFRHDLDVQLQKHFYEDKVPNVNNYLFIDPTLTFLSNDTVRQHQRLTSLSNQFSINGYIGKIGQQLQIEAGLGNRVDQIINDNKVNDNDAVYVNNYLFGQIRKEAATPISWSYGARTEFYFAGRDVGNFTVQGHLSKYFKGIGAFQVSAQQSLLSPALNMIDFKTNYFQVTSNFDKISITSLQARLEIEKLHLGVQFNNHILNNYQYLNEQLQFQQFGSVINVSTLELNQTLSWRQWSLESQAFVQNKTSDAPLNLPNWGINETLAFNSLLYTNKLNVKAGLQLRYIGPYNRAGYSYLFNQFYYNPTETTYDNPIEVMAFANFKVKNLRFYILGDQLQQLVFKKNVIYVLNHPMQSTMYRFGFKWTLYN